MMSLWLSSKETSTKNQSFLNLNSLRSKKLFHLIKAIKSFTALMFPESAPKLAAVPPVEFCAEVITSEYQGKGDSQES